MRVVHDTLQLTWGGDNETAACGKNSENWSGEKSDEKEKQREAQLNPSKGGLV